MLGLKFPTSCKNRVREADLEVVFVAAVRGRGRKLGRGLAARCRHGRGRGRAWPESSVPRPGAWWGSSLPQRDKNRRMKRRP